MTIGLKAAATRSLHTLLLAFVIAIGFLSVPCQADAKYQFEFIPSIHIAETYNDNIELDSTDEISDFITTASPAVRLNILSEKSNLSLNYAPTFVWYKDETVLNTTRHSGDISFNHSLTEHLRFDLTNTLLKSEDPLQDFGDASGERAARSKYWRNTGQASVSYLFGREDALSLGYRNNYQANDDPTLFDGTVQTPFTSLTYWFTLKNAAAFDYEYTDSSLSSAFDVRDFTGHRIGARYIHRFMPQSSGYFDYHFTSRDFNRFREDYEIHDVSLGYDHVLSSDFSFALGIGYFLQHNNLSDDNSGLTYDVSLNKIFQHGSFILGGNGGWAEQYLDPTRTEFIEFWSAFTNFEYQILEPLSCYLGGNYRWNEDQNERTWKVLRANVGLRWVFLQWLSLVLDYAYTERFDDVPTAEYNDNRIMLTLGASKLYKW